MSIKALRRKKYLLIPGLLACTALLGGCGDDGDAGAPGAAGLSAYEIAVENGFTGTEEEWLMATAGVAPESCSVCHSTAGADHQAIYNDYADASAFAVTIDDVTSVANGDGTFTSTMTFTITKDGAAYVDAGLANTDQKRYYAVTYDSATSTFGGANGASVVSYGTPTHVGNGQYTVTNATATFAPETSNAFVYAYIADGELEGLGSHYTLYDDVANVGEAYGDAGTYVSAANVAACEKCHGAPYMKHGYRAAEVAGLADFAACKVCHLDDKAGGHQAWQVLVDDPERYIELNELAAAAKAAGDAAHDTFNENLTVEEAADYAYKRSVMNDVHMSHAMEFAYPQSMANCVTCHDGKLAATMTNANFTAETCKSCHPVTGPADGTDPKRAPALLTVMPATHAAYALDGSVNCTMCHDEANTAAGTPVGFSTIHAGYDDTIYAADGTKYADAITVSIDSASVADNVVTIDISAAGTAGGLDAADILPEVMIGLYGYDSKDFIVNGHDRYDSSGNGVISRSDGDLPKGAYEVGTTHAYWTTVTNNPGDWSVTTDLTEWADMIADGTIKRVEIAVLPILENADGEEVALNAPSKTFDLTANAFDDDYFTPIVDVANGCNTCHDALATTFHSPDRSGNIVVCRMCHVGLAGGSHLEMQSRSIDSYVHAIHSFQAFDIGDIDFTDDVEALHYEHHIESTYPNFTILNCESCHNADTYEVPDQSKSMPGVLSASDSVADRNIGTVPSYVTGPASRACGSCHRATMINEDEAGELASFNQHTKANGYLVEETDGVLDTVIDTIMSAFE